MKNELTLRVLFPSHVAAAPWEASHSRLEVPSRWPYGLDMLADSMPHVVIASTVRSPSFLNTLRAGASLGGTSRNDAIPNQVNLSWEENSAVQMVREHPNDHNYAGVIWATDKHDSWRQSVVSSIARRNLRNLAGLWVLSRPQLEILREYLGDHAPPMAFIRFGVDADFFQAMPHPTEPLIVSAGGDRDRDVDTLFAALDDVFIRTSVRSIVQTSSTKPSPNGVTTVARMTHVEMRTLLARSSVVAVATRENLHVSGMTVALEAMATSRPVVISNTPGMGDYVRDGVTGRVVAPRNPQQMSDAVVALLEAPDMARTFGQRGRQIVEEMHTTKSMAVALASFVLECEGKL